MFAVLVVFLSVCLVLLILWKSLRRNRDMNLPPMAAGALPIVGHTLLALQNRERLYNIAAETVLGTSLKKGNEVVTFHLGIWEAYDKIWKRHRKLISPAFNQSVLDTYMTEFNDQSRLLVQDLVHEAGQGSFDQIPYVKHTVLQIGFATLMGVSVDEDELRKQISKAIETYTDCMVERIRKCWYHNEFLFSLSNLKKKQDAAAETLHELSYQVLMKKKAILIEQEDKANECADSPKPTFKSFLDLLLDLSKEGALTESEIGEEVETFIWGAYDTTSHALGTTLLNIGTYPEVQQKFFNELQEVFEGSDRDVEKQDLSKLKYLEAVIKESLRLYPPVFGIGRNQDRNLKLGNYTLPAGSRTFLSIYSICRHPVWGTDAELFRPERWLDGSLPTNARAYAVFGLGRRNCIGPNFALMSMKTILAHVVRRYRISGDVTQLVQNIDVVCRLVSGYHISIDRREEQSKEGS